MKINKGLFNINVICLGILIVVFSMTQVQASKAPELANSPPMGWNSWNHFACDIDEKLIKETADAMVESGLRDAGYQYVNMDDCWHGERDVNGFIQPDEKRFPSGMKDLADYVHARGLKFGIYSDAGLKTCAGRPGSQGYEYQDALQYARWGVDYLKYDWCNTGEGAAQRNPIEAYTTMSRALMDSGRPILLSICEWGDSKPWLWAKNVGHMWRTTGDIINCWDCEVGHGTWASKGILPILDQQDALRSYAGKNAWNDPDMMEVGNLPTLGENRAHFAMWAMLAAPLIIGTDVRQLDQPILDILLNREIIAINQDPLAIQGFRYYQDEKLEIWLKLLTGGDFALAFLNRSQQGVEHTLKFDLLDLEDSLHHWRSKFAENHYTIVDLWNGENSRDTRSALTVQIAPRDVQIYRFNKVK
ncbi:alpha-galactosidase [Saccharobesus litoralis]|uniref:Alpha-galactosidase n=1 Tax=Saccharobesus litoralis TaxID=2172099 RepID=A0A2S0VP43_9ALTE|nr:glycoside hydrolase family 27 protein [Saccharobesus litoralis]AWB65978.1 alpha-galactosidase [Saccharobesus litoralis]